MFKHIADSIRNLYKSENNIPLHAPVFRGNEKKYLLECIDTTYVSSVGRFVNQFEDQIARYTGAKFAVAVVNGTSALHIALQLVGVKQNEEVLIQPLTFIATANAVSYTGAVPVFIDVDMDTLGMSPNKLSAFLSEESVIKNGICYNKKTGRKISACMPMHTFGHSCRIDEIKSICQEYNIPLIEDATESLGTTFKHKHTGTFGIMGVFSFNGNKTITTGGGGMIITNNQQFALKAKHITTTAKVPHQYEYVHDEIGYNYRLTNLAAALGCAQMEQIDDIIKSKRNIAAYYQEIFKNTGFPFISEPKESISNYWLNALLCKDLNQRNEFLEYMNDHGIMCRPIWKLINKLKMYQACQVSDLSNAYWLEERIVNIPSSVI